MRDTRFFKRILPVAVVGARTSGGAVLLHASAKTEIEGKRIARVGDKLIDPIDGEVTIISGLDQFFDDGTPVAGLGSVLSNGTYIVDSGQNDVCWAEDIDGGVGVFVANNDWIH